jgi:hypothetical protein
MQIVDPVLFAGFNVAWHVPSPSEGGVREGWFDSDVIIFIQVE